MSKFEYAGNLKAPYNDSKEFYDFHDGSLSYEEVLDAARKEFGVPLEDERSEWYAPYMRIRRWNDGWRIEIISPFLD